MKWKKVTNTLMFKLLFAVTAGIFVLAAVLYLVNRSLSEEIFAEYFSESQQKIFNQIDRQFYRFYEDIWNISGTICESSSVKSYLVQQDPASVEEWRNIYYMKEEIKDTRLSDYTELNVVLVGVGGKRYIYNWTDDLAASTEDILSNSLTERAREASGSLICEYRDFGFDNTGRREPSIVMARAVYDDEDMLGCLYIVMREVWFREMYNHFTSDTSEIAVLNGEGSVISSNRPEYLAENSQDQKCIRHLAEQMEEQGLYQKKERVGNTVEHILYQRLQSSNYHLIGIVDPKRAFEERYDMVRVVLLTLFVTGVVLLAITVVVRQQTRPLASLAETMRKVRGGNLDEYGKVEGTEEIRELTGTYNQMIRLLGDSVDRLIATEKEKRAAEIHALQMQINPHYVYNTLTSIKMLIWQGNDRLSTEVIDAFVQLLRNTISNTQEFITVRQEIENVKHYVFINQVRYGDAVKTEYYVACGCEDCLMPKMILQPFVENAFFHAFSEGKGGLIQVFAKKTEDKLILQVKDNGVGMSKEQLGLVRLKEERSSKEHLTGIGINNVDNRLKLLYGEDCGVQIESEEGRGTKITIIMLRSVDKNFSESPASEKIMI